MRITLLISSLRRGGAEQVVKTMADFWAVKGWKITILTVNHGALPLGYDIHPNVEHRDLKHLVDRYAGMEKKERQSARRSKQNPLRRIWQRARRLGGSLGNLLSSGSSVYFQDKDTLRYAPPRLMRALREEIVRSDSQCVISFTSHLNLRALLALHGLPVPIIVSERKDPGFFRADHNEQIRRWWDRLWPEWYLNARYVVTQTENALRFFSGKMADRVRVIPNPVLPPTAGPALEGEQGDRNRKLLIALGNLRPVKGYDLLLQAFAQVSKKQHDWRLEIWGDGPQKNDLEKLTNELQLSDRVHIKGFARDPHRVLSRADLFVLSSLTEGFPNALCEAMACGLPAVSFDCPGTRAIVRDGEDGLLAPMGDISRLGEQMDLLMGNRPLREQMGARAREITRRFSVEKVMSMWEALLP